MLVQQPLGLLPISDQALTRPCRLYDFLSPPGEAVLGILPYSRSEGELIAEQPASGIQGDDLPRPETFLTYPVPLSRPSQAQTSNQTDTLAAGHRHRSVTCPSFLFSVFASPLE